MSGFENPGAYDEARKRIRETAEREMMIIEEKRESFEKGKEKIRSRKKFDVYELKRRIETGQSLDALKSVIREAMESGDISPDTYRDVIDHIEKEEKRTIIEPQFTINTQDYPLSSFSLTKYFENQKLGENIFIDITGFVYGIAQGSLFVIWLAGKTILDILLLPVDIYRVMKQ